jgi:sec-independent protein translocase protein TatB
MDGLATLGQAAQGARLPMMGISGMELMVIVLVTLILFGPKELPEVIRTAARALGFLRRTSQEFQRQMDQLVRDSETDELRRELDHALRDDKRRPNRARPRQDGKMAPASLGSPAPGTPTASLQATASKETEPQRPTATAPDG